MDTQIGRYVVTLDAEDLATLRNGYILRVRQGKNEVGPYLLAKPRGNRSSKGEVRAHRLLLGAAPGQLVDHINGNTLDNRRANLRLCTASENARNRRAVSETGYRGVTRHACGKWQAKIAGRYLGLFDDIEEAARAADAEQAKQYACFARLNGVAAP